MTHTHPNPEVTLVSRRRHAQSRSWDRPLPAHGLWKVTGPAGGGISSLLIDTTIARLEYCLDSGLDPSGIVVIAPSKESGARLRRELSERVADYSSQGPLVRSVHSLAFGLLRLVTELPVRMITGAEQDAVMREILQGHAEEVGQQVADAAGAASTDTPAEDPVTAASAWPVQVRPALSYVGFARQLRDFLLRAVERNISAEQLVDLGRDYDRPMWVAAGEFLREYTQMMELEGTYRYSAAELLSEVSQHLDDIAELSAWHTVIVDDAHLLDPISGALISALIDGADLAVVGGNPDQAVFRFRGATSEFFDSLAPDHTWDIREHRRSPQRRATLSPTWGINSSVVVDCVRRRHLEDAVAWSQIAVVVRSAGDIGSLRRSLLAAGVPVYISPTDLVLAEQPIIIHLMLGLRALDEPLTRSEMEQLVLGPVGGADPVTLRRLIRGLRRFDPQRRGMDSLQELVSTSEDLPDFAELLTEREIDILNRIRRVIRAGRDARKTGSVEDIVWAVWEATGLSGRLSATALRGGASGSQADRDLDAVMTLFDAAGDFVERYPQASIATFMRHIAEQELPTGVRERRGSRADAVEILTAHGTVGREWDTVIVSGVQEGAWPDLSETGSLFGQEDLVDLLDEGIDPDQYVSHVTERLAEERRLFHVATTRARELVVVTAVHSPAADEVVEPSRFVSVWCDKHSITPEEYDDDLPGVAAEHREDSLGAEQETSSIRVLSTPSMVAELRRAVCDESRDETTRNQAARQLARLARAGVPGAHPDHWWSMTTTVDKALETQPENRLSPSRIQSLLECPLRDVLQRLEETETTPALLKGNFAHLFFEALARGADPQWAEDETTKAYVEVMDSPEWKRDADEADFRRILQRSAEWIDNTRGALTFVGSEVDLSVDLGDGVRLIGRIDRLETDGSDNYVIIDLKTSASAISQSKAQEHVQLKAYQLALARGRVDRGDDAGDVRIVSGPGESVSLATLVYPANKAVKITTRDQARLEEQELEEFERQVRPLSAHLSATQLVATPGDHCDHCGLKTICPAQPEGQMVSHD